MVVMGWVADYWWQVSVSAFRRAQPAVESGAVCGLGVAYDAQYGVLEVGVWESQRVWG